jgi:hypothetical protein
MKASIYSALLPFLLDLITSARAASFQRLDSETEDMDTDDDFSNMSLTTLTPTAPDSSTDVYNWPFLSLSLFSIFGILGNFLVCFTIKRDSTLQTKTNYYLFSLAITDLAVCVIVIPLSIIQDFSSEFFFFF